MLSERRTLYLGSDHLLTTNERRLRETSMTEFSSRTSGHRWHSFTSPRMTYTQFWPKFSLVKTTGIFHSGYCDSLPMSAIALLQFSLHTAAKRIPLYPYPSLQCLVLAHKIKTTFFLWPSNPCTIWLLSPSLLLGSALCLPFPAQPQWLILVP